MVFVLSFMILPYTLLYLKSFRPWTYISAIFATLDLCLFIPFDVFYRFSTYLLNSKHIFTIVIDFLSATERPDNFSGGDLAPSKLFYFSYIFHSLLSINCPCLLHRQESTRLSSSEFGHRRQLNCYIFITQVHFFPRLRTSRRIIGQHPVHSSDWWKHWMGWRRHQCILFGCHSCWTILRRGSSN